MIFQEWIRNLSSHQNYSASTELWWVALLAFCGTHSIAQRSVTVSGVSLSVRQSRSLRPHRPVQRWKPVRVNWSQLRGGVSILTTSHTSLLITCRCCVIRQHNRRGCKVTTEPLVSVPGPTRTMSWQMVYWPGYTAPPWHWPLWPVLVLTRPMLSPGNVNLFNLTQVDGTRVGLTQWHYRLRSQVKMSLATKQAMLGVLWVGNWLLPVPCL